jgi:hypothetical protein
MCMLPAMLCTCDISRAHVLIILKSHSESLIFMETCYSLVKLCRKSEGVQIYGLAGHERCGRVQLGLTARAPPPHDSAAPF